jgi:hypothetical protein
MLYFGTPQIQDEFGTYYDPITMRIIGIDQANEARKDIDIPPRFAKIKLWLLRPLMWLFDYTLIPVGDYRRNIKGKYYSRKKGILYKNVV